MRRTAKPANFDRIARPYRWLEYFTMGTALMRCRLTHIARLCGRRSVLVLGDGDGRFLARLLAENPQMQAVAVDSSQTMLSLLQAQCDAADLSQQIEPLHSDALGAPLQQRLRTAAIKRQPFDTVVTHFLLDCLTEPQLSTLTRRIVPAVTPDALWLVSEFHIPTGPMRLPARLLIGGLYRIFGLLTGLRVRHLPDYASILSTHGFIRIAAQPRLGGMLVSELWQRRPASLDTATDNSERRQSTHTPMLITNTFLSPPEDIAEPNVPGEVEVEDFINDPIPDPEPASPSLPAPDPGIYHPGQP